MTDFPRLAQALMMAHKAVMMYTYAHPQAQALVGVAHGQLTEWFFQEDRLQVVAVGPKLFAGGTPQDIRISAVAALARLMTERAVSGLIFEPGLTLEETRSFLEGFILKPARLDEVGGLECFLRSRFVTHIKVSQIRYREVQEGDDGDAPPLLDAVPAMSDEAFSKLLSEALRAALEEARARGEGEGPAGLPPADLSGLGGLAQYQGFGDGMPSPTRLAQIRRSLMALDPAEQFSVLEGLPSLPESPAGLAVGLRALVGESLAAALAVALSRGVSWDELQQPLTDVLRSLPERQAIVRMITARLKAAGQDGSPLAQSLKSLEWEGLSLETRLLKVLEEGDLYSITHDMRLALLRELLDQGRDEEFLRVLDRLLESLRSPEAAERQMAVRTLAGVARWAQDPGLPPDSEIALADALKAHFAWEPDPSLHLWSTQAMETMLGALVFRGQLGGVLADLQELEGLSSIVGEDRPWRLEALQGLRASLARPQALDLAIECVFGTDRDRVVREVHPYLEALGAPMAMQLMHRLEHEPDRARRGRLVEAIRSLGPAARDPLLQALESPLWFLVRNTLTILADVGDAGCLPTVAPLLRHPDVRVRQGAVRALWKMGGPGAEPYLVGRMADADEPTLTEILFGLGQLKGATGLPQIANLALGRKVPERLRIQALEALGLIGAPAALPTLVQGLRRKTLFSAGEEPPIRLAAARALQALGTPEGRDALARAAASEPAGEVREAMIHLLAQRGAE